MEPEHPQPQTTRAALDELAARLDTTTFAATIVNSGSTPCLRITNRHAPQLTEDIYAGRGYYWYSWAEHLAAYDNVTGAAAALGRVLRTTDGE
jgi:hypothetical protein